MATKLAGYTDQERAVLRDCRKKSIVGGLTWGIPSLLPLWVVFKAGIMPRSMAAPSYTVAFVLFSLLGTMSNNNACIESILDMEDSKLAEKLRKSLPKQARLYDKRKALRSSSPTTREDKGTTDDVTRIRELDPVQSEQEKMYDVGGHSSTSSSGEWMQRQDSKRAVRRNKYGDPVFEDDVK